MAILETVRKLAKLKNITPPEKVGTPGRIEIIIDAIIDQRKMLEVAVDERLQSFSSSGVIDIDKFKGSPCLLIDTLIPKIEGIRALETASKLEVGFRLNKVPYTFYAKFLAISDDSSPQVTISYPEAVFIHQFRNAFRISPTLEQPISVNIKFKAFQENEAEEETGEEGENTEIAGTIKDFEEAGNFVEDISIDGMAFLTKSDKLSVGKEIYLDFTVPGVDHFKTRAVVMNLSRADSSKYPFKCGIRFEEIPDTAKDRIYQYLIQLQRRELKRQRGIYEPPLPTLPMTIIDRYILKELTKIFLLSSFVLT